MSLQFSKSISDPVYGSVPLTDLEVQIIDLPVFQRLRHIQQLGLASYAFPSADYSRFAHSIGACHMIGEILQKLPAVSEEEIQFRRVAMLLHDVGHYFMSHATEGALKPYFAEKQKKDVPKTFEINEQTKDIPGYIDHENLGKKILKFDPDLSQLLKKNSLDPERIGNMFKGAQDEIYGSLVSSELDADRLDYLMRSSQATGLPYGHFDRHYLLQSLTVDNDKRVCIKPKAIRAADHYIMCRSFDYLQVVFQKTVVGFEEILKRCIRGMLEEQKLILDDKTLEIKVKRVTGKGKPVNNTWLDCTDAYLMERIASFDSPDPVMKAMRDRLLNRQPAKLLWSYEAFDHVAEDRSKTYWQTELGNKIESRTEGWHRNCIFWYNYFKPTPAARMQDQSAFTDEELKKRQKSIHVLEKDGTSSPLVDHNSSFTRHLATHAYIMVRVYFVGPPEEYISTRSDFQRFLGKLNLAGEVHS